MIIVNKTPFVAGWTQGFAPDGRELVVVVVRGTYDLCAPAAHEPILAGEQLPVLEADELGPDPAVDAPRYENDFGLFKPRCDVLLVGKAYAPGARPCSSVEVGLRVGPMFKRFRVTGPRVWTRSIGGTRASPPVAFVEQEISYDVAFGGTDVHPDDPQRRRAFLTNPCGIGYHPFAPNIDQAPLCVTEEIDAPVRSPTGDYRPMALGPLGRNWYQRYPYAGTYDDEWQANKLPFLPDDFDWQYFQAAPLDQQIPYPTGGEPIALHNLTPEGQLVTTLPQRGITVVFVRRASDAAELPANLDTILIEPDDNRLTLVWRATCAMKRDAFELEEMVVLDSDPSALARDRARRAAKTYYPSLADAVKKGGGR